VSATLEQCDCGRGHVERWYSFGYYAGKMCSDCAYEKYRDHCGQPSRCHCDRCESLRTLAEFEYGGWAAIEGD